MFKKKVKYILILIIIVIIFIILKFNYSNKNVFEDIMIFGLWQDIETKNEYEISSQDSAQINIFETINDSNKVHKKIAPGSYGNFIIKFRRSPNSTFQINVREITEKPQNLVFIFENKKYSSIKDLEKVINEKFINTDKITINWEWKYGINENEDMQDTEDGKKAQKYIFEIEAIIDSEKGQEYEI